MDKKLIKSLYAVYCQHPLITTDSRNCVPDALFFALKGERFDGNQYAAEVLSKGCALAVVDNADVVPQADRKTEGSDGSLAYGQHGRYFYVPSVLTMLQQLAAWHREQFRNWTHPVTVIGITGTNGKTTTKELIKAVLSQKYSVLATEGNLNNQIGVPITLLKIRPGHEFAIIEMGANHPMDIADLCEIVRPDYGLITNVGKAHLLGFGSLEGVISAKTKLYDSIRRSGGTIFVDCGNEHLMSRATDVKRVIYGNAGASSVMADSNAERPSMQGRILSSAPYLQLELIVEDESPVSVKTNLIGDYNLINVIAASAIGHHFGVSVSSIRQAIEGYVPQNMRSQLVDLGYGNYMILDAYNANPTSMNAAIRSFAQNDAPHKNLILGDMRELGEESHHEHQAILQLIAQQYTQHFEFVLLVGQEFAGAFKAESNDEAVKLARQQVRCYADVEALCSDTAVLKNLGGTTLVKGSRGIRLEKVADTIREL